MIKLSVNVNKIATLRNSRGGSEPSVRHAVETCVAAGAPGITVHPRADERHIRAADATGIADSTELVELQRFFHPNVGLVERSGRVIVLGSPPAGRPSRDQVRILSSSARALVRIACRQPPCSAVASLRITEPRRRSAR